MVIIEYMDKIYTYTYLQYQLIISGIAIGMFFVGFYIGINWKKTKEYTLETWKIWKIWKKLHS